MAARCSNVLGLPGEELETFIKDFTAAAERDPFATWLILPTNRLVRTICNKLDQQNIPYLVSRICTLKGFCENYFEENRTTTRYLSPSESTLLLEHVLKDNKKDLSLFFTREHPTAKTLENLQEFIKVIIQRKVQFPECLLDLQGDKSDQLDRIIRKYRESLHDPDLVDEVTLLEWTIKHLKRTDGERFRDIFMYGIHRPLPLEEDLISLLRERSVTFRCFIPSGIDPDVFADPLTWAGKIDDKSNIRTASSLRNLMTGIFSQEEPIDTENSVRLDLFPSHHAELQAIAAEICRIHNSGVPLSDISIAFPELKTEFGNIEEVFSDFGISWNASISRRLLDYPVIRFLVGIIKVVAGNYAREDVVRLLSSPYFRTGRTSLHLSPDEVDLVSRHALVEEGRREWQMNLDRLHASLTSGTRKEIHNISPRSVERVRDGIGSLFELLKELEGKKSIREFISAYKRILEIYELGSFPERDIVDNLISRLEKLSNNPWLFQERRITTDEFLRVVQTLGDDSGSIPVKDAKGVSILGIRECAHQHFPYLFICGLVEGAVPSLTTRLPFTNSLENARMGTRSLADILHEQEYYFIAALLSAEKLYLSAPLVEGGKPLLSSAFFEQVRRRCNPEGWMTVDGNGVPCSRSTLATKAGELIGTGLTCQAVASLDASQALDDLVDRINMEGFFRTGLSDSSFDGILSDDEEISMILSERFGPEHVYSPTSLETYAECPFRFFLRHIIHLEELPDVELNLSARDRGSVIHAILTTFYRRWRVSGKSKVSLVTLPEAVELMRGIIEEELARHSFDSPLWEATCAQMRGCQHGGPGYFERFLEQEAEEEGSPLVPSFFEFSFGMERGESDDPESFEEAVELTGGNASLRIHGRIDRIDICPDGFFLIYDYKTGSQHPGTKDIEAGKALQLPLYLLAYESVSGKRGVAAGYYKIRKEVEKRVMLCDETGKDLLGSRVRISPDLPGTLCRSRDYALDYICRIRKGEFPLPYEEVCPNPYCEFRSICRFDRYRVFEGKEVA